MKTLHYYTEDGSSEKNQTKTRIGHFNVKVARDKESSFSQHRNLLSRSFLYSQNGEVFSPTVSLSYRHSASFSDQQIF